MKAIISILCLILISSSVCWWNEGHMIVAEIAKLELSVKNPEVIKFFEDLTKILEPMRHGKVNSFSESATWPDIMKSYGAHYLDNWHFDDIKVNFTDPSTPDVKEHVEDNALFFLFKAYKTLTEWTKEESSDFSKQFEKSFTLSFMVHIVGDIHQPLHSCAYFSDKFPKGDRGGNDIKMTYGDKGQIKNLHMLWDSVLLKVQDNNVMPLDQEGKVYLEKYSKELMKEYTRESLDGKLKKNWQFDSWIMESWRLCKEFVYPSILKDPNPTQDYIRQGEKIARERLALAGYRLSDLLMKFYKGYVDGKSKKFTQESQ